MAKKVELIIGGQYEQKGRNCDSCIEQKKQVGGQGINTIPETIYVVAKEEGKPNPNYYCSPHGVEYLRGLEQHTSFDINEYSNLHKTPQQLFNEKKQQEEAESQRKKNLYNNLNK